MEKRLKRFLGKHPPCLDSTTSRRMDFAVDPKPGFYVVQVKPVNVSIDYLSVRMHLSTPHPTVIGAAIYPDVLGGNITTKQVEVTTKADDEDEVKPSVEVSWDPVTSAPWSTSTPDRYQYCLVISQDRPHRDNCLLDNEAMGIFLGTGRVADARQTVLEDLAAEDWHKEAQRLLAKDMEREYREKVVHTNCQLGGVYKVIVDGLQPSVAYYVDVFVRDRQTLLSSRYQTSNFTLAMPKPKRTSKAALVPFDILPDSVDMGIGMVAKSGYRKLMLYRPPTQSNDIASAEASGSTRKLYIFVQPCGGVGPIQMLIRPRLLPDEASVDRRKRQSRYETIYMPEEHWPGAVSNSLDDDENDEGDGLVDSGALFVEEVTETKTYEVTLPEWFDVHNATHYVEFEFSSLATRQSRTLVVHVADSLKKFPYPRMPADRTIRVRMLGTRRCSPLTLLPFLLSTGLGDDTQLQLDHTHLECFARPACALLCHAARCQREECQLRGVEGAVSTPGTDAAQQACTGRRRGSGGRGHRRRRLQCVRLPASLDAVHQAHPQGGVSAVPGLETPRQSPPDHAKRSQTRARPSICLPGGAHQGQRSIAHLRASVDGHPKSRPVCPGGRRARRDEAQATFESNTLDATLIIHTDRLIQLSRKILNLSLNLHLKHGKEHYYYYHFPSHYLSR